MTWWRWTREWLRRPKAEAQRLPHVGQETTLPLEDREACACRWWRIWRRSSRSLFRLASNVTTNRPIYHMANTVLIHYIEKSSAITEGPRDAWCPLKSCQLLQPILWRAFSRAHTSHRPWPSKIEPPIVPCYQEYDWRSLVTTDNRTWIGARKLFTNIPIYLHTDAGENNLPPPSVGR